MDEMDLSQFKDVFVQEAREHLVSLNSAVVELEKNPDNKEMINQIFRAAHTLKGMSATMGFDKLTSLAHRMEDVLDKFRKGEMRIKKEVLDIVFRCFDVLEKLVDEVDNDVKDSKIDVNPLIEDLNNLLTKKDSGSAPQATAEKKSPVSEPKAEHAAEADPAKGPEEQDSQALSKKVQTSIRINISYLDTMMNLVGEMVISKSQLEQIGFKHNIEELNEALQQFDRIAIELQEAVLKTRMVTLSQIFDRYPRMVRDLSMKLNKEIEFDISGADIEIDRLLIDEINEPLLHLLRNAMDHGVETPEERIAAGKKAKGKIGLSASRERGYISIKVTDDGKGLDPVILKRKAIEKNIITEETAKGLTDEDTYMLICDPRFSTAEQVSDISGRGVGMDVVKTAMESINGHLVIESQKGLGTAFTVNLPLTMAIISALLVAVGNEVYAVALNNITEIISFADATVKSVGTKEVVVLRDEVLPLIRLSEKLSIAAAEHKDGTLPEHHSKGFILRVESGTRTAGLLIDNFIGRKEIVIKSLSGITKRSKGFSGATILGDGSVVLIIDVGYWV
jgi:two-component system chemotaxis sensor kinase CheA